ncbi:MAG: ferritin [Bacteroidales bacterium]
MLNKKMNKALNEQINAEFYAAYLYLAMSAYFHKQGMSGFANWMRVQYQEELAHCTKFFDYIAERGGEIDLLPIEKVPSNFKSTLEIFERTLKHEEHVTECINNLANLAIEVNDHATQSFLRWYIDEQVEEESSVQSIIDSLRLVNGEGQGLFMLDRELAQRKFVDPTRTA